MSRIRILDDRLANQIAAGEVVERPASVVKELVENAIDAGADRILVEIEEGGIRSIRVVDNGCGMDREDAQLAFSRHATSKILRERDLFAIRTLGFRGEALPSIASVSRMTLTTAERGAEAATRVELEGGEMRSVGEAAHPPGTEVVVRDLFFNTPARLKHLKTVNTEVSHVADIVGRLALAHPEIRFTLRHDGRELIRTLGDGKLLHVVHALYGGKAAGKMISLKAENADFRLTGLIGRPELTRSSRSYLSTIINGRHIRSLPLIHAVLRGYDTLLPVSRYPVAVLSIELDPKLVDVNVHPAKMEVRLSKEKELTAFIEAEIKKVFRNRSLAPRVEAREVVKKRRPVQQQFDWNAGRRESRPTQTEEGEVKPKVSVVDRVREEPLAPLFPEKAPARQVEPARPQTDKDFAEESASSAAEAAEKEERFPDLQPLAQVHGTYIVAQAEDGFYLIDQHAAHERIYYERVSAEMRKEETKGQPLLMPIPLECSPGDAERVSARLSLFREMGWELEPFGGSTFLIRSHPRWVPPGQEEETLRELIDWLKREGTVRPERVRDAGAKLIACKAAIKANRHLSGEEMSRLLTDLANCDNPFTCPHGRPVMIHFSTRELEKLFKRVM
jgi:DNA mismatch repair protein MutL